MPGVPAFILRRLYVKDSLRNTSDGWQFTLRNSLGSGYAKGLVPLKVDDVVDIPLEQTSFENEGVTVTFDQVTDNNRFGLQMNKEIVICVSGDGLSSGEHKIYFGCIVPGLGQIGFDFTDEIQCVGAASVVNSLDA